MAVILFWKLEKNSIVRDMSKATADRKESHKTNSYSVQWNKADMKQGDFKKDWSNMLSTFFLKRDRFRKLW